MTAYSLGSGQAGELMCDNEKVAHACNCMHGPQWVATGVGSPSVEMVVNDQGGGVIDVGKEDVAPTCRRETRHHEAAMLMKGGCRGRCAVRRITPVEGERLQGFADNWTRPCFRAEDVTDELCDRFAAVHANWSAACGRPGAKRKTREQVRKWLLEISSEECPDGPRYKAVGNSMSVNVMAWIGMRIELAERAAKNASGGA